MNSIMHDNLKSQLSYLQGRIDGRMEKLYINKMEVKIKRVGDTVEISPVDNNYSKYIEMGCK